MTSLALDRRTDLPFDSRGPLSSALLDCLTGGPSPASELPGLAVAAVDGIQGADVVRDEDVQLSLFALYAIAYGSLPQLGGRTGAARRHPVRRGGVVHRRRLGR